MVWYGEKDEKQTGEKYLVRDVRSTSVRLPFVLRAPKAAYAEHRRSRCERCYVRQGLRAVSCMWLISNVVLHRALYAIAWRELELRAAEGG